MTDHSDLIAELRTIAEYVCWDKFEDRFISDPKKHPAWRAADALSSQSLSLSEAIEALSECEEYFDNRADADCDQDGFIPNKEMRLLSVVRTALQALENGPAGLADAPSNPPLPDLSSLRKGAEVAVDEIVTRIYRRFKDWSERKFSADDVTWCEVKADVLGIIALVSGSREEQS